MRLILILLTFSFFSNKPAFAGKIGFDVGTGQKNSYGLFGLGFRYFPNKHFDLNYTAGVDYTGSITTIGTRIYSPPMGKKCFFFIPCVPLYYAGIHYGHSNGGTVTHISSVDSDYEFSTSDFLGFGIGVLDLFGDLFFYTIDIGYKLYYNSPSFVLISGPTNEEAENTLREISQSGLSASFTIGLLF